MTSPFQSPQVPYPRAFLIARERTILDIKEACYIKAHTFIGEQLSSYNIAFINAELNDRIEDFQHRGILKEFGLGAARVVAAVNLNPTDIHLEFYFDEQERHTRDECLEDLHY